MTTKTATQSINPVRLGNYLIDPTHKTISRFEYFEEDDYERQIHSWGERCTVDSVIDFNTTCLYVFAGGFEFKEHYVPPVRKIFDREGNLVDMSSYKSVGEYFEKNGEYFYIYAELDSKPELHKLEMSEKVDFARLKPDGNNFYHDDEKLYYIIDKSEWLNGKYNKNGIGFDNQRKLVAVAKGSGNAREPVVKGNYCIYDGKMYWVAWQDRMPERIDAYHCGMVEINANGYATVFSDGKTLLVTADMIVRRDTMNIKKWKQLTDQEVLESENNNVYMSRFDSYGGSKKRKREPVFAPLFATPQGFVKTNYNFTEFKHYDKVFIFNDDKKENEEIDTNEFQLCAKNFYVYRGKPHYENIPVTDTLDFLNLKYITNEWLTDGKCLINLENRRITNASGENVYSDSDTPDKHITFGTVPLADISNLRVIYDQLLFDGINFYSNTGREIQVIPVKDLGVEVKVID